MIWTTPKIIKPVPRSRYAGTFGSGGTATATAGEIGAAGAGGVSDAGPGSGGRVGSTKSPRKNEYLSRPAECSPGRIRPGGTLRFVGGRPPHHLLPFCVQ